MLQQRLRIPSAQQTSDLLRLRVLLVFGNLKSRLFARCHNILVRQAAKVVRAEGEELLPQREMVLAAAIPPQALLKASDVKQVLDVCPLGLRLRLMVKGDWLILLRSHSPPTRVIKLVVRNLQPRLHTLLVLPPSIWLLCLTRTSTKV